MSTCPGCTGQPESAGFSIIDVRDPRRAKLLYTWRIENPELHRGIGGLQGKYFKLKGRYYYAQSFQFGQDGPDADLGAVIVDVTGLPDTSHDQAKWAASESPRPAGGFHNIFTYKHSDGRALLFATSRRQQANIYDMGQFLERDTAQGRIGQVPIPDPPSVGRGRLPRLLRGLRPRQPIRTSSTGRRGLRVLRLRRYPTRATQAVDVDHRRRRRGQSAHLYARRRTAGMP